MKIVLTAISPDIGSKIDARFGRGAYLLVIDTETGQYEAYPNPGVNARGGAGIQAAQFVTAQKVQAVISGDFGPNAFDALQTANIPMYLYGKCDTVHQAMARFKAGQLQQVGEPTRADFGGGHHGLSE
jgi:predicted Fe-Mo cluster-binding NifX family protein